MPYSSRVSKILVVAEWISNFYSPYVDLPFFCVNGHISDDLFFDKGTTISEDSDTARELFIHGGVESPRKISLELLDLAWMDIALYPPFFVRLTGHSQPDWTHNFRQYEVCVPEGFRIDETFLSSRYKFLRFSKYSLVYHRLHIMA